MSKLSTAWTGAVAYVSLLTGSGLSVAGNVADTFRTRGEATDGLDIILAGAWPILVILTIEMFVSRRWAPSRGFQALRWFGCLAIGNLAMLVSWLHLHDLMASRGQLPLVAMAGPLAIDGMAIMATGLILSTRGRTVQAAPVQVAGVPMAKPGQPWIPESVWAKAVHPVPLTREDLDDASVDMWTRLESEMASEVAPMSAVPVSPASSSNVVRAESVPADAQDYLAAWTLARASGQDVPRPGEVDALLAGEFDVQPRTIRRWRTAVSMTGW